MDGDGEKFGVTDGLDVGDDELVGTALAVEVGVTLGDAPTEALGDGEISAQGQKRCAEFRARALQLEAKPFGL